MSPPHDEFAQILLAHKVITPEQLIEALDLASKTGTKLQDALFKLGHVSRMEVIRALAEYHGLEFIDLAEETIPQAVVELVPESVARENVVLPLAQEGRILKVVLSDPTDLDTMEKLQFILNKQITPVLAPKEQIVEAINRHYGQSETESVDSMLAEFTDTAIDFTETEATHSSYALAEEKVERTPRLAERRATVRYYSRMNPERLFPLLVILSRAEVEQVIKRGVSQASSRAFAVAEGSLVEVEPVLPGCECHPPRERVKVVGESVSVTFWVVPRVMGRVMQARVVVRQGGEALAEVPLDVRVARQGITRLMGALSLVLPFGLLLLKQHGLDFETQAKEGFGLYAQIAGWLVRSLTPEVLTGLLLAATAGLYFWLRPRRREVFWDIKTRQPSDPTATPSPEPLSRRARHTADKLELARELAEHGKASEALELYERALRSGRCRAVDYFRASLLAHQIVGASRALDILKRAEAALPASEMKGPLWYNMGCFAARLGRFADALGYLNRAIDAGYANVGRFRDDPDLEPLRWRPDFRRLLAEIAR